MGVKDRNRKANTILNVFFAVDRKSLKSDAIIFVVELSLIGNGVFSEAIDFEAAQKPLPLHR